MMRRINSAKRRIKRTRLFISMILWGIGSKEEAAKEKRSMNITKEINE
ncbi:MAG: hypothetical protein HFI05_16120 [Lachnospiraceae bacterium]|nr:hypothetical protein [Lachnospiraceae bacterium]